MATAPSPDVSTHHPGELDELFGDLLKAGFLPVAGDSHRWRGPINPALATLTPVDTMEIEVRDGWPYLHPYVHVAGLMGRRHVNPMGNVCLWEEDEGDYTSWLRFEDIKARIDAWVADQASGAGIPPLDAHLYFTPSVRDQIVILDLDALTEAGLVRREPGRHGDLRATFSPGLFRLGSTGGLTASWFWIDQLHAPPATSNDLRRVLSTEQGKHFEGLGLRVRKKRPVLAILLWSEGVDVVSGLGLRISKRVGPRTAVALPIARSDEAMLRLRSGPDAAALSAMGVAVFGVGADRIRSRATARSVRRWAA